MKSRLIGFIAAVVILIGGAYSLQSQALIDQLRISGNWALMGDFFVDEEGNYIYVQEVYASEGLRPNVRYSDLGLTVGNQVLDRASGIEAGSPVPGDDLVVYDYFILKLSPQFELLDYQVISQTNQVHDVSFEGGKLGFIFFSHDDHPLHIGDEVYHTDLDSNASRWGVILNNDLEVEWVASFPSRSVDQICPAGAGDSSVYVGVNFGGSEWEVIVFGDTLRNHLTTVEFGTTYLESVMIFKYDIALDSIVSKTRIGGNNVRSRLHDMQLNNNKDLVTLGYSAGVRHVYFGEQFTDSARMLGIGTSSLLNELVLAQFNKELNFDWATTTPETLFDVPQSFKQGSDGSIYVRASLRYGDTLRIRDTLLKQPIGIGIWGNSKSGVIKFDSAGVFQWIHQIEGGYDRNSIYSMRVDDSHNLINFLTFFQGGYGYFGDTIVETIPESDRSHLASINYGISTETGGVEEFYYSGYGNGAPRIDEIAKEDEGRWMGILLTTFLQDSFFGEEFPFTNVVFFRADPNAIVSAIEQARDIPMTLYPNPARSGDRIRIDGLPGIRDIQAIHISGRPAAIRWSAHAHGAELYFSDALPSGLYLLQVETEEGIQYAKIQVQ